MSFPNKPEWLSRPARKQVDDATLERERILDRASGTHNLWYGRRLGSDDVKEKDKKEVSKYCLKPVLDVGKTKGSEANQRTFCLYFCKGCCNLGVNCTYLHRLPTAADEAYHSKNMGSDIFGREKFAEHEGYRKGAGTFERDNRTIYVNYEGAGSYELPKIRELLEKSFHQWGTVNNIYIVHHKTIAFVRYDWRSSAEFAKEAMHRQRLQGSSLSEILTLRWANEDPNPVAIVAKKRKFDEQFEEAVQVAFDALPEPVKQAQRMQAQLDAGSRSNSSVSNYPETDDQYEESAAAAAAVIASTSTISASAAIEPSVNSKPKAVEDFGDRGGLFTKRLKSRTSAMGVDVAAVGANSYSNSISNNYSDHYFYTNGYPNHYSTFPNQDYNCTEMTNGCFNSSGSVYYPGTESGFAPAFGGGGNDKVEVKKENIGRKREGDKNNALQLLCAYNSDEEDEEEKGEGREKEVVKNK